MLTKKEIELHLSFAKALHSQIIAKSGGQSGVRDEGGLYNSLCKVWNRQSEKFEPTEVCAYTYKEFATRHHFNDGNKENT